MKTRENFLKEVEKSELVKDPSVLEKATLEIAKFAIGMTIEEFQLLADVAEFIELVAEASTKEKELKSKATELLKKPNQQWKQTKK